MFHCKKAAHPKLGTITDDNPTKLCVYKCIDVTLRNITWPGNDVCSSIYRYTYNHMYAYTYIVLSTYISYNSYIFIYIYMYAYTYIYIYIYILSTYNIYIYNMLYSAYVPVIVYKMIFLYVLLSRIAETSHHRSNGNPCGIEIPIDWWLPGLVNIQKAIENGPVEIVDLPMKNGDFP